MRGRKVDFAAADVGAAFSVVSANRVEISDCDVWATSNFAYIYVSSGLCHELVQFDCQHLTCVLLCSLLLVGMRMPSGSNHAALAHRTMRVLAAFSLTATVY